MEKRRYEIGLLIGRFQPFHNGHLYLIKESLKKVDLLIIGIGSSNLNDEGNPFDFGTRKKMVETVFEKEGLSDRLLKIVPIPDVPDDDEWLQITLKAVGKSDIVIGNNEWTNGIFEKAGIPVLRIAYHKRHLYEGSKIRQLLQSRERWEDRVPYYLVRYLKFDKRKTS